MSSKVLLSSVRNQYYYILRVSLRKYSTPSYIHNPGSAPLKCITLGRLLEEAATKYGDRPALISRAQNQVLTFQQVLKQADKLAAGFRSVGLNPGDRIGIWAPNISEWYLTNMACGRGGFVLVNINPAYLVRELENCITSVGVKAIVCPHKFKNHDYYDNISELAPELLKHDPGKLKSKTLPSLKTVIITDKADLEGTFNFGEILDKASDGDINSIKNMQDYLDPDGLAHLQFTSGTTGKPKAAMQTHFHIVNNGNSVGKRNELDKKHQTICMQVPFFHVYGTVISQSAALNHGATLVLPNLGYDPDKALDAIRDEKCTVIYGTPTMYVDLINRQKVRKEIISPEIAVSGGAHCSVNLFKEMKEVLGVKKVKSVYGLTETTAVVFQSLFDDDEYHSTSSVGYVSEHIEAKIIDEKGTIVPRGTPGELCIRGYCNILGYWENEEKTKELMGADKWLRTGDTFVLEEDGYGKIVGRLKEIIIRGGENIYPAEIENFLNAHPDILEVHVIGVPHERLGEEVCAFVRLAPNSTFTLEHLKSFCKGKISHFKIPSVLKVIDAFPKTTSGKIQKFKLLELMK
ncbi:medium-chain acyl-CoA ligase ACSF2, mitochondrial-like isoform X1 [Anthonomus grandis grandis]|uniref:medium-chain acyl-CoA ligase ACSF2, mitochondrial-like isoform X1 n=1 Tax=Anthonomus grandis grandis TaxID=2921223 RepID=UPI002165B819|nr:medium-chain acyl-CoA ligase ACSF2, mitochondrial-like isoform X1 [Anthonomus grandis grandis]